jgi:WD40-like Beta Propeller Repeat
MAASACSGDIEYVGATDQPSEVDVWDPRCEESDGCFKDPTVSLRELQVFSQAADAAIAPPTWEYPLADSVHPSNLALLTLHFHRGTAEQTLFEVRLKAETGERRFYLPCLSAGGDACTYQVPESFWQEAAIKFAGESAELSLRGSSGNSVSSATSVPISFSAEAVEGGLYYWELSTSSSLLRLVFGGRQAVAYIKPGKGRCVGCHSVSRDGGTIAFTEGSAEEDKPWLENAAFEGGLSVAKVTTPNNPSISRPADGPSDSGMVTLSSNGSRAVAAYDYQIVLRDTQSGAVLDQVSELNGLIPFFPEFSPNDRSLVVTLTDVVDSEIAVRGGGIFIVELQNDAFGAVTELVPEEEGFAHYYPTWSPDGRWIAFVTGPVNGTSNSKSYDEPNSRLRLASLETGKVWELNAATGSVGSTTTWPKFAPFEQCDDSWNGCAPEERVFFLTFSSKRPYGVVANQPGDTRIAQLWLSSVSAKKALAGEDPSDAPIWLPYQSTDSMNHLAYWTEALRCNSAYPCGPGQECANGRCEIIVK